MKARMMSKEGIYGIATSYRRGPKTQRSRELILLIPGVKTGRDASKFIGRSVECRLPGRILTGRILRTHGRSGGVLARFNSGVPGQIIGSKVTILE